MKLFKYLSLFVKAFNATKREMLVSVIILVLLTFILAAGMFLAESRVNPDFSYWDALVWHFVKYVDDPSEIASAPVTTLGKVLGTIEGLINVAIFAVPAGLVGSGLIDAMDETRHEKKIAEASVKLHKRFRRAVQSESYFKEENNKKVSYRFVPRYRSLAFLQVKTGLKVDDLIEAVDNCPDMRLMNMASCERQENHPQDRIAVVHFPLNREYGCCLDRESDVTIVAPTALNEIGPGSFAFSLAAMGGFNYVSKELSPNPDDTFGFYLIKKSNLDLIGDYDKKEDVESQALHYLYDLKQLKQRSIDRNRRHWFIFILGSTKTIDWQVHLWRLATDRTKELPRLKVGDSTVGSTVTAQDENVYQTISSEISRLIQQNDRKVVVNDVEQNIVVTADNRKYAKTLSEDNVMCRMGGGKDCNAFTIRLAYDIIVYSNKHLLVVKDMADAIKNAVEPDRKIDAKLQAEARRCYLEPGDGYADEYGKEEVFLSSPEKLKAMIEDESKKARDIFEKYDLDWNEIGLPPRNAFARLWQKIRGGKSAS